MKSVVYMVDTNILLRWADTFTSDFGAKDERYRRSTLRIKHFCENNANIIVVPDLVWVEFLSVMLHKDIDVQYDYRTTMNKFKHKQSLVNRIRYAIETSGNWVFEWEPDVNPFADAADILNDPGLIDEKTFKWMQQNAFNRSQYMPVRDRLTAKIMDGMDSAIMVCLNELALQEENRSNQVILYTADYPLCRIIGRFKQVHQSWFAHNTGAIFALHEYIRCRHKLPAGGICREMIDAEILLEAEMVCLNDRKYGKHLIWL